MVVSVSVYSRCPRIPCEEKRLDMWRSNFRCRNHRHDGGKARHASFTSLTAFQSITLKVLKLSILTVQVSKTVLFLRHGIERKGINTFFKSNTVSFETSRRPLHAAWLLARYPSFFCDWQHQSVTATRAGAPTTTTTTPIQINLKLIRWVWPVENSEEKRMKIHEVVETTKLINLTQKWCSTIAGSEPWFILISTCNLSLPFVDFKASAPGKRCCNWSEHFCQIFVSMILHLTCTVSRHFFPTHLDSSSVKSSNLFRGLNFREVSWWQDADAAGLNAVDVELLDGSVSSNRFGLGEPLVREMEPGDMVKIYWNMWKYLSRYKDVKIQIYVKGVYLNIFEHVPYMMYVNINEIRYDYGFKKSRLESESFKLDCKYLLSTLTLDTFFDTPSQAANSLDSEATRMPLSMLSLLLLTHSNWKKCQELCLKTRSSWCPRIWRGHSSFRNRH